jgi:hypothetical protein
MTQPQAPTEAYIERVVCQVTLNNDLESAKHEYRYTLMHFGDDQGEDSFYFFVPNARPDQIGELTATDGEHTSPSTHLTLEGEGTKILFSNLARVATGQPKILTFSYNAPTSALLYRGRLVNVCFYRVLLEHAYTVRAAKVIINLPRGSHVSKDVVNDDQIKGTKIEFEKDDLEKRKLYSFPTFFYRRKKIATLVIGFTIVFLGALLEASLETSITNGFAKFWNWYQAK